MRNESRTRFRSIFSGGFYPFMITEGNLTEENFVVEAGALLTSIKRASACGVPFIQIREKRLDSLKLAKVVGEAVEATRGSATRIFVNERFDVALAGKAFGVHLSAGAMPTATVRENSGGCLAIGRSVHDYEELLEAKTGGADYCFVSPVFSPLSKSVNMHAIGLNGLKEFCARAEELPVYALGGITNENIEAVRACGASGYAGISIFR
ncbi:MAG: thiamine phosphate synthase [Pyrinomonadaceae bacterium]